MARDITAVQGRGSVGRLDQAGYRDVLRSHRHDGYDTSAHGDGRRGQPHSAANAYRWSHLYIDCSSRNIAQLSILTK